MTFLRQMLNKSPVWVSVIYSSLITFSVYSCMYGFRKAFAASGYDSLSFAGIDFKIWLICAQLLGYMASKFYGIRFIAGNSRKNRAHLIIILVVVSWIALLFFAVVPPPFNIIFLFINGFPLGLVWGLVFSYVEGRRFTELMGVILACSFIFASGFAKTVGSWLLSDLNIPELWMPFTAGAVFILPLIMFSISLEAIPPPSTADEDNRTVRRPMTRLQRKDFVREFVPGLFTIIAAYVLLTVMRDFRDNFSNEILAENGLGDSASIFTKTETPVAIILLLSMGAIVFIRNNYTAFLVNHLIVIFGFFLSGVVTILFANQLISPYHWFWITGTGLYLAYIPFNVLYFERMIALFRISGNVGFVIYIADSFGYLGSAVVLIVRQVSALDLSWSSFYIHSIYGVSVIGVLLTAVSFIHFRRKATAPNLSAAL